MKKLFCAAMMISLLFFCSCTLLIQIPSALNPTPSMDSRTSSRKITLQWEYPLTDILFSVFLGTTSEEMSLIARDLTQTTVQVDNLLPQTTYFWKVMAKDVMGRFSYSQIWSFVVTASQSYSLLIGVSEYDSASDLKWTQSDVADVEIVLSHLNNEFKNQKLLARVTKTDVENASTAIIEEFADQDTLLFFYAGHGGYDSVKKESYLFFSDSTKMYVSDLRNLLSDYVGTKIVILDSCYSGGFTTLNPSREEQRAVTEAFNRSVIEGLTESSRESNLYILTAAKVTQSSWEDAILENGIFSFFLADGLGHTGLSSPKSAFDFSYNADTNLDKKATLNEIFNYSFAAVKSYLKNIQDVQVYPLNSDFVVGEWN